MTSVSRQIKTGGVGDRTFRFLEGLGSGNACRREHLGQLANFRNGEIDLNLAAVFSDQAEQLRPRISGRILYQLRAFDADRFGDHDLFPINPVVNHPVLRFEHRLRCFWNSAKQHALRHASFRAGVARAGFNRVWEGQPHGPSRWRRRCWWTWWTLQPFYAGPYRLDRSLASFLPDAFIQVRPKEVYELGA